ncbi:MAG: CBS domain-containing protein [Cryomorphaceae bacterium]|nr:MAG: CBS domain-containing protein [Cryomorphaceae bacterium]
MYSNDPNQKITRARDVMSKRVVFIDGMATAREAADLMRREKVDVLVVKKRHADDAFGIVAVQDLIRGVVLPDRSPDSVNIYEIMTKPVITVPADMDIRYVVRLMVRTGIRRAPVIENDEKVGMISFAHLILEEAMF